MASEFPDAVPSISHILCPSMLTVPLLVGNPQPNPSSLSSKEETWPLKGSSPQELQGQCSLGRGAPCSPPKTSVSQGLALHLLQGWGAGLALWGSTMRLWVGCHHGRVLMGWGLFGPSQVDSTLAGSLEPAAGRSIW